MNRVRVLVTCEHGGNKIPAPYRPLFAKMRSALASHRGYDPGALALARDLAKAFDAELVYSTTSRLLVELNRSPNHKQLFSEATLGLPPPEQERVLARYYRPYRDWVESQVGAGVAAGAHVVHISSHSFTPQLGSDVRRADVGLLYDPTRRSERDLCLTWRRQILSADRTLVVRRNYPYRGSADGLTTHLRKRYPDGRYTGVEIEVNQKHTTGEAARWRALRNLLVDSLRSTLGLMY
ncbi:MAG TPA: N-formylglutamate amidohydrolase [Burkholderiales bacterium]|nr:N-formylglutamate amidohydrolase [Burkholderiales bacterium]